MRDFSPHTSSGTRGRVAAVLGPTNTGKTHYAIERMLAHRTGVIGLPLRLLAREVYDKIVAIRGPSVVALVTGEERIVPERTQYWVCTVEAMPLGNGADFLAIDEIQLCADPERGHVFTDRLLHARGLNETLFLGSDTMRGAIAALVPGCQFMRRERMSELTHVGSKKISRMPPRSAIVGFSVENLYAMAELLRRQKGGAAVVMGALSPRTRNAQVELYQNGDVDVLVATDAIGMGLNLDIKHVAFSGLRKFDGRRMRDLMPHELAQIAGRAGRHTQSGTFGVTGEAPPLDDGLAEAITSHRFAPVKRLWWRNSDLDFGTAARLIASLEERTAEDWLSKGREADDLMALKALAAREEVAQRLGDARDVKLLWDVCRIPDFRGISHAEHADLLGRIFGFLRDTGRVPDDWMARQVKRIDRTEGDIDALSKRLAYIRTWTYVAQRTGWVDDESHWRGATRAVEDRLSDALHGALTQRFVDRRTSVLLRRLKQKESLVAEVTETGDVTVEGQVLGRIEGFRFAQDATAGPDEAKTLRQAAMAALRPEFTLRADRMYNAPDTAFDMDEAGVLTWNGATVGKLVSGPEALKPTAEALVEEEAGAEVIVKVQRRLQHFVDRRIATQFEPLLAMAKDEAITGLARGVAFRLLEGYGIVPRAEIAEDIRSLDQEARGQLRKHGVRFGQFTIFLPLLLKPAPTRMRLILWGLEKGLAELPQSPPPGLVTIPHETDRPEGYYTMSGYRPSGSRAIRIDMLERLADMLRGQDTRGGFEATADMLSISGLTLEQFADLMGGLGYRAERGERPKVKAAPEPVASDAPEATAPEATAPEPAEPEPAATDAPETMDESVLGVAPPTGLNTDSTDAQGSDTPDPSPQEMPVEQPPETPPTGPSEAPADTPGETPPEPPTEVPQTPPPADAVVDDATPAAALDAAPAETAQPVSDDPATAPQAADAVPEATPETAETEVFYTFAWAPKRRGGGGRPQARDGEDGGGRTEGKPRGRGANGGGNRPRGADKPGGKGPQGKGRAKGGAKGGKPRDEGPRTYTAKPERSAKVDPDNPFAVLAALKDKS